MPLGLIVECVVAVLLVVTIGYCYVLNKRLKCLRADEASLRATIAELVTATEIAERAILGLKSTAGNADRTLGARLGEAEEVSRKLSNQLQGGEDVLERIGSVAASAQAVAPQAGVSQPAPTQAPEPAAVQPVDEMPARKKVTGDLCRAANETASRLEQFRRRTSGRVA
ncbi:DUF6468 domain-containing protein [Polycladidibacter hongkongensis]|uniref:DUF6468 domain-containing protein n=1 Tax=Polycladidibacter hongkongensis TaxID=1647556 RepID=UPI0008312022|nr:DUF6468 domain-containing protein [Pseudovibrio hongkongensis]